jgi:hypothetical protein
MVIVPFVTFVTTDWTETPVLLWAVASPTLVLAIPPGTETVAVVLPAAIVTFPLRPEGGHWTDKWNPRLVSVPVASDVWT